MDSIEIERRVSAKDIREAFDAAMGIAEAYKIDRVLNVRIDAAEPRTADGKAPFWTVTIEGESD